ncbi:MAG: hypothetical protein PHP08_00005 [Candidatus Dojkabacteria bacterium]|nr:hypothetical protein [Candidatus Dojkabacteria bacterium]
MNNKKTNVRKDIYQIMYNTDTSYYILYPKIYIKISDIMVKEKRLTRKDFATSKEWNDYRARTNGYKDYEEWVNADPDVWAQKKGFKNYDEVLEIRGEGTKCEQYNRFLNESNHRLGISQPYDENEDCSLWLGIYIAERLLPEIFEEPKMMPRSNKGYDAICRLGYKIDVKSSCLLNYGHSDHWHYGLTKNKTADYFIMFAFDNRKTLNLLHIWLIKGEEIFRNGRKLNDFTGISIINTESKLKNVEKYELKDKLDRGIKICDEFKKKYCIKNGKWIKIEQN